MKPTILTPSQTAYDTAINALSEAYQRGYKDFCLGSLTPTEFNESQKFLVKKRRKLVNSGEDKKAAKVDFTLLLQGIHLTDVFDDAGKIIKTEGSYAKEAFCPYTDGTLLSKEWQRGVNAAYFDNLSRVRYRERKNALAS